VNTNQKIGKKKINAMIQAKVGQRSLLKGVVCATAAIVCVLIHQAFANHAQQEYCDDIGENYGENARGTCSTNIVGREFTNQIRQVFVAIAAADNLNLGIER
jgi:hypothetical protein